MSARATVWLGLSLLLVWRAGELEWRVPEVMKLGRGALSEPGVWSSLCRLTVLWFGECLVSEPS